MRIDGGQGPVELIRFATRANGFGDGKGLQEGLPPGLQLVTDEVRFVAGGVFAGPFLDTLDLCLKGP